MTFTPSQEFETIAAEIKASPTDTDNATKLKLYGLFKQVNLGDSPNSAPFVRNEATAKLNAWVAKKGTSREDAQEQYIAEAKKVLGK